MSERIENGATWRTKLYYRSESILVKIWPIAEVSNWRSACRTDYGSAFPGSAIPRVRHSQCSTYPNPKNSNPNHNPGNGGPDTAGRIPTRTPSNPARDFPSESIVHLFIVHFSLAVCDSGMCLNVQEQDQGHDFLSSRCLEVEDCPREPHPCCDSVLLMIFVQL